MSELPSGSSKNAMWQTPESRVADELDALRLELRPRLRDVGDAQRDPVGRTALELDAHVFAGADSASVTLPVSNSVVVARVLRQLEHVAVERDRPLDVARGHVDEVHPLDLHQGVLPSEKGAYRWCSSSPFPSLSLKPAPKQTPESNMSATSTPASWSRAFAASTSGTRSASATSGENSLPNICGIDEREREVARLVLDPALARLRAPLQPEHLAVEALGPLAVLDRNEQEVDALRVDHVDASCSSWLSRWLVPWVRGSA